MRGGQRRDMARSLRPNTDDLCERLRSIYLTNNSRYPSKGDLMPIRVTDDAFEYLLARAGLSLTDAEKAELRTVCDGIAAMAENVRKPRGRMAEPALTYGFAEEDL